MDKNNVQLSDEINKLFETLDIKDAGTPDHPPCLEPGALIRKIDHEKREDVWRMLLVDFVQYFALSVADDQHLKKDQPRDVTIMRFIDTLRTLDQKPNHERSILIRAKEQFYNGNKRKSDDYTVFFGDIVLDIDCINAIVERNGIRVSYLENRLKNGFTLLARYQIRSLYLEIPKESPADIEKMRLSLRILAAYHQSLSTRRPAFYIKNEKRVQLTIIEDENRQPNPNLALLAALNDLEPEVLKGFVSKVDAWMHRPEAQALRKQFTSIYSALFGIKKIREKLTRPPFEINNVHWSMLERVHDVISNEKARLVQIVDEKFHGPPEQGAKMMESIYGNDFDNIRPHILIDRLCMVSELLKKIDNDWEYQETIDEILSNVRKRLEYVPDDIFCATDFDDRKISYTDSGKGVFSCVLPPSLARIVSFYRGRAETRQKVKKMISGAVSFSESDYRIIALEFKIKTDDAKQLIRLLSGCFDEQGGFVRDFFEARISDFINYEKKVFEFLWYYLSEILMRKDRLAFLNAMQRLIERIQQPKKIVLFLLSEICKDPLSVRYSDRNALMLCSILIRSYNKEVHIDIEITPEEVLLVKNGINTDVAGFVSQWMDRMQKIFLKKTRTIHLELKNCLDDAQTGKMPMPVNFLVALEREMLIFLSLIGGETSYSVVRSTVRELGDPDARIYQYKKSRKALPLLLQLLRVAIRGLGRAGEKEDIKLLTLIIGRKQRFMDMDANNKRHTDLVRRAINWAEKIAGQIPGQVL